MRAERLPAIVRPEPIGRGLSDLFFEEAVDLGGEKFRIIVVWVDRLGDSQPPARPTRGPDRDRNHRKPGANGKRGGQGRGGSKATEERRPESSVSSALIDQDANYSTFLE